MFFFVLYSSLPVLVIFFPLGSSFLILHTFVDFDRLNCEGIANHELVLHFFRSVQSAVLKYWMFDKNRYGSYLTHMHILPLYLFDVFLCSILITTGTGDLLSPWLFFFNSAHFCRLWQTKLWRNSESWTCASFFQECSVSTVLKYWMFDKNRYSSYLTHMHSFEINLFVFPVYLYFSSFPLGCLSYLFYALLQPLFSFYLLVPGTC